MPSLISAGTSHKYYRIELNTPPSTGWETYLFNLEFNPSGTSAAAPSCDSPFSSGGSDVSNAFDSDSSSRHRTSSGNSNDYHTVGCEYTGAFELGSVSLKQWSTSGNQFSKFTIQASDDGSTYWDVYVVTSGDGGWSSSKENYSGTVTSSWILAAPTVSPTIAPTLSPTSAPTVAPASFYRLLLSEPVTVNAEPRIYRLAFYNQSGTADSGEQSCPSDGWFAQPRTTGDELRNAWDSDANTFFRSASATGSDWQTIGCGFTSTFRLGRVVLVQDTAVASQFTGFTVQASRTNTTDSWWDVFGVSDGHSSWSSDGSTFDMSAPADSSWDVDGPAPATPSPTPLVTSSPTVVPTLNPTLYPTVTPTLNPTLYPTITPTLNPTLYPTAIPTFYPTPSPTMAPTTSPTLVPTLFPTSKPTLHPTLNPTSSPTIAPTLNPTLSPTDSPQVTPAPTAPARSVVSFSTVVTFNGIMPSDYLPFNQENRFLILKAFSELVEIAMSVSRMQSNHPLYELHPNARIVSIDGTKLEAGKARLLSDISMDMEFIVEYEVDGSSENVDGVLLAEAAISQLDNSLNDASRLADMVEEVKATIRDEVPSGILPKEFENVVGNFTSASSFEAFADLDSIVFTDALAPPDPIFQWDFRVPDGCPSALPAIVASTHNDGSTPPSVNFFGGTNSDPPVCNTGGLDMSGVAAYASVTAFRFGGDEITIEVAVNLSSLVGASVTNEDTAGGIIMKMSDGGRKTILLSIAGGGAVAFGIQENQWFVLKSNQGVMNTFPTHIVATADNNTMRIFVNGTQVARSDVGASPSHANRTQHYIGAEIITTPDGEMTMHALDGTVKYIKLWQGLAISADQARYQYKEFSTLGVSTEAPSTAPTASPTLDPTISPTLSPTSPPTPFGAMPPDAEIIGPASVGPCSDIFLDGQNSKPGITEPFNTTVTYRWFMHYESITNVSLASILSGGFEIPTNGNGYLSLPRSESANFTTYYIGLVVTNSAKLSSSTIHTIRREATNRPIVSFEPYNRDLLASQQLALVADASPASCAGEVAKMIPPSNYKWSVTVEGTSFDVQSISPIAYKFVLPPLTFTAGMNVAVHLNVTDSNGLHTMETATFKVRSSPLVANIQGGAEQTLNLGASFILDASSSEDPDDPDNDVPLSYFWTCYDVTPSLNGSPCVNDVLSLVTSANLESAEEFAVSGIPALSSYMFSVNITKDTRFAETSVTLYQNEGATPTVFIETSDVPAKVNPSVKLSIRGQVSFDAIDDVDHSVRIISTWSIDNDTIGTEFFNSPIVTKIDTALARTDPVNVPLILRPLAMNPGSTYTFRLSAHLEGDEQNIGFAALTVQANIPPTAGLLQVRGINGTNSGTAMLTSFTLTALQFSDDSSDLPLSYRFLFVSDDEDFLQIRERTTSLSATDIYLPQGDPTTNELECVVQTFDKYDAYSEVSTIALVSPPTSTEAALNASSALIAEALASGNNDAALSVIASSTKILQAVDCSLAADCSVLNRHACGQYKKFEGGTNMCGDCLSGFVGLSGPAASSCVPEVIECSNGVQDGFETDVDCGGNSCVPCGTGKSCISGGDCNSGFCDSSGICDEMKKCPTTIPNEMCSGNGQCIFADYNDVAKDVCGSTDSLCEAVCLCSGSFVGDACQYTAEEREQLSKARLELLLGVREVQKLENSTSLDATLFSTASTSLGDQANAVKNLVAASDEIDSECTDVATELLTNIAFSAKISGAPAGDVSKAVTEAASSLLETPSRGNDTFIDKVNEIMDTIAMLELANLVEGEDAAVLETPNLKMASQVVGLNGLTDKHFKPPGGNSSSFQFLSGFGGPSSSNGVVVLLWGENPHPGSHNASESAPASGVVKLTVSDIVNGVASRRLDTSETNISISTHLTTVFDDATVDKIVRVNCTAGVAETKQILCPHQTYLYDCDGLTSTLMKFECLSESLTPLCGMYNSWSNKWSTENCFEDETTSTPDVLKCTCIVDLASINPEFVAMANVVAASFVETLSFGVNNVFTVEAVVENPSMFMTIFGMLTLSFFLCYKGYQKDEEDKEIERDSTLMDYRISENLAKRQRAQSNEDKVLRENAIERLIASEDENDRKRAQRMKHDLKINEMTGGQGFMTNDEGANNWDLLRNATIAGTTMSRIGTSGGKDFAGITAIAKNDQALEIVKLRKEIKDSVPKFIQYKNSRLTLFAQVVTQFHSLLFVVMKKYNGQGMDRPTKVAFVFLNLVNLMFVTAVTYELRAGSEVDVCFPFDDTSFAECIDGGGESPFNPDMSRCIWEFESKSCNVRPISGDTWKIAAFISVFTTLFTVPLNFIVKKIFFSGILPPGLEAVRDANRKYLETISEDANPNERAVKSWEFQCLEYREWKQTERKREQSEWVDLVEQNAMSSLWKYVPRAIKRFILRRKKIQREAQIESKRILSVLLKRRQEMSEAVTEGREGVAMLKAEALRLDLLLISQGADKMLLSEENGGERTEVMDRLRGKLARSEFDELFKLGDFCNIFPDIKSQQRVIEMVWERWLFLRFNYVVKNGRLKNFHDNLGHTYRSHMVVGLSTRWRKMNESSFWRYIIESEDFDGRKLGQDKATIFVEVEEKIHDIYVQVRNDLKTAIELEDSIAAMPVRAKGTRLLEYYNMIGLSKLELIVYKLNLVPINTLPLATQDFSRYIYWLVVIAWGSFCIFYLLSFAVKHGNDVTELWLKAFFFTFFQKALLNEPQTIFVKHVLFPFLFLRVLETTVANSSTWQLHDHVWIHSPAIGNNEIPVGAAHRVSKKRQDIPSAKYILHSCAIPIALREPQNAITTTDGIGQSENSKRRETYFTKMKEFVEKGEFSSQDSLRDAADSLGDSARKRFKEMKGQLVKLESDVMKQAKNQKLYMALGVFLLLLGLLAVLDEIGLGDVFMAAIHAVILLIAGDDAWKVLGYVVAPSVALLVGGILAWLGITKGLGDFAKDRDFNKLYKRLWYSSGLNRAIRDRDKEDGVYVESVGSVIWSYFYKNTWMEYTVLAMLRLKKDGICTILGAPFVRLISAWKNFRIFERDSKIHMEKQKVPNEEVEEVDKEEPPVEVERKEPPETKKAEEVERKLEVKTIEDDEESMKVAALAVVRLLDNVVSQQLDASIEEATGDVLEVMQDIWDKQEEQGRRAEALRERKRQEKLEKKRRVDRETLFHGLGNETEYDEGEGWDDESLLAGNDSDAMLEQAAMEYTVPGPFSRHAFKMSGPMASSAIVAATPKRRDGSGASHSEA